MIAPLDPQPRETGALALDTYPRIWFDEAKTEPGREALGWYHEKRDAGRELGLGPAHDWASHAADAFGLMCVDYAEPRKFKAPENDLRWII